MTRRKRKNPFENRVSTLPIENVGASIARPPTRRSCVLSGRRLTRQTSAGAYRMRPLSWPPLRGGSARRRWGREPCGSPEYFGSRLAKNFCRGEHCSPVPVCRARNCPGKCVAAVSWRATNGRPYIRNREKTRPLSAPTKTAAALFCCKTARLRSLFWLCV